MNIILCPYVTVYIYIAGQSSGRQPSGPEILFININVLFICSFLTSLLPLNDIFLFFPIQMHGRPMLTLPYKRSRSFQGHDLYKLCRAPLPDASCQVSKS